MGWKVLLTRIFEGSFVLIMAVLFINGSFFQNWEVGEDLTRHFAACSRDVIILCWGRCSVEGICSTRASKKSLRKSKISFCLCSLGKHNNKHNNIIIVLPLVLSQCALTIRESQKNVHEDWISISYFEVQICVLNSRHKIVRHVAFQEVNDLFSKHRVKFLHQSNCTCAGRQIFHQEQNTFVGTFGPIKFLSEFQKDVHSFIGVFSFSFLSWFKFQLTLRTPCI